MYPGTNRRSISFQGRFQSNLDLVLFQTPCHSTRGALKRRLVVPQVVIIVFIPHIANLLCSSSSYLLFLSPYLPAMPLSVPLRHTIPTVKTVYSASVKPSLRCCTISFPQLADTAPIANITSNRLHASFKPRDKSSCAICGYLSVYLPVLVARARLCFFQWAFWLYLSTDATLFPITEYRPNVYSGVIRLPAARPEA